MVNISDLNNCAVQPSGVNQDRVRKNVNGKCEINREKSLAEETARNGKVSLPCAAVCSCLHMNRECTCM